MRPVLLTLTLLAATAVFAQTDQAQQDKAQTEMRLKHQLEEMRLQQELYACPVGITARHQGSPATIWTTSLEDANKTPAQLRALHSGVHVDLNAQHKEIKQADLEVFYLPPGTRMLPVAGSQFTPSQNPAPETHKNFVLAAAAASHLLNGDLLLGPVASVTHITLMHITYTDGTEWTAPSANSCSVEPSKFMPVQVK